MNYEFAQFDTVALFLVTAILKGVWPLWMKQIAQLASFPVFLLVTIFAFVWIWIKGKDRRLEATMLFFVLFGGELLEEGLRRIFHRVGPAGSTLTRKIIYTFPSEQSFMMIAVFGMVTFLLIRHSQRAWSRIGVPFAVLLLFILIGLNNVYFEVQYPSDVIDGYVFGGVWLSLTIILLEIFRLLRRENLEQ
jgi:membrane-associated phospholipid phosphatase